MENALIAKELTTTPIISVRLAPGAAFFADGVFLPAAPSQDFFEETTLRLVAMGEAVQYSLQLEPAYFFA
jgi:hypothetical protein